MWKFAITFSWLRQSPDKCKFKKLLFFQTRRTWEPLPNCHSTWSIWCLHSIWAQWMESQTSAKSRVRGLSEIYVLSSCGRWEVSTSFWDTLKYWKWVESEFFSKDPRDIETYLFGLLRNKYFHLVTPSCQIFTWTVSNCSLSLNRALTSWTVSL